MAQDPTVEDLNLTSDDLLRALRRSAVTSVEKLVEATRSDAQVREVFSLRTASGARRLRAALRSAIASMG